MISDLEGGIPTLTDTDFAPLVSSEDMTPEALQRETAVLTAQEAEMIQMRREREIRRIAEQARQAASEPTAMSRALLASLDVIPEAPKADGIVPVANVTFPLRIGRALFRAGDFMGALRHLRQVSEEDLSITVRYEMARCYEETGDVDSAIKVLADGMKPESENEGFWMKRARALHEFLEKSRSLEELLKKE